MDKYWICHDYKLDQILECKFGKEFMKEKLYEYFKQSMPPDEIEHDRIDDLIAENEDLMQEIREKDKIIRDFDKTLYAHPVNQVTT
jgi:hypothetical protein